MGWTTGLAVYGLIWWVTLFMVLPWGVRRPENPEPVHEAGAPENPRLWLKAGVTTAIAAVITIIIWFVVDAGWIDLRDMSA